MSVNEEHLERSRYVRDEHADNALMLSSDRQLASERDVREPKHDTDEPIFTRRLQPVKSIEVRAGQVPRTLTSAMHMQPRKLRQVSAWLVRRMLTSTKLVQWLKSRVVRAGQPLRNPMSPLLCIHAGKEIRVASTLPVR